MIHNPKLTHGSVYSENRRVAWERTVQVSVRVIDAFKYVKRIASNTFFFAMCLWCDIEGVSSLLLFVYSPSLLVCPHLLRMDTFLSCCLAFPVCLNQQRGTGDINKQREKSFSYWLVKVFSSMRIDTYVIIVSVDRYRRIRRMPTWS